MTGLSSEVTVPSKITLTGEERERLIACVCVCVCSGEESLYNVICYSIKKDNVCGFFTVNGERERGGGRKRGGESGKERERGGGRERVGCAKFSLARNTIAMNELKIRREKKREG